MILTCILTCIFYIICQFLAYFAGILSKRKTPATVMIARVSCGGDYWTRTSDLLRVKQWLKARNLSNIKLFMVSCCKYVAKESIHSKTKQH